MWKMKSFCINIRDSEHHCRKIHIRIKGEDLPLLRLALSDSTSVVGFWEE